MSLSSVIAFLSAVVLGACLALAAEQLAQATDRERARRTDARALRDAKRARLLAAYLQLARIVLRTQDLREAGDADQPDCDSWRTPGLAAELRRDIATLKLAVLLEEADLSVEAAFTRVESALAVLPGHPDDRRDPTESGLTSFQRHRNLAGYEQVFIEVDRLLDVARAQLLDFEKPI